MDESLTKQITEIVGKLISAGVHVKVIVEVDKKVRVEVDVVKGETQCMET